MSFDFEYPISELSPIYKAAADSAFEKGLEHVIVMRGEQHAGYTVLQADEDIYVKAGVTLEGKKYVSIINMHNGNLQMYWY